MKDLYLISIYYQRARVTGANKRFDELGKRHLRNGKFRVTVIVARGEKPDWCPDGQVIYVRPYKSKLQRIITWLQLSYILLFLKRGIVYSDFQPVPLFVSLRHMHFQLIHDLRNWTSFGRKGLGWLSTLFQVLQLRKADRVVTVSEFSKTDIVTKCGIDDKDVIVAYNGVPDEYFSGGVAKESYSYDVIYVATFEPRKNHLSLVKALEGCPDDTKVVFIGRDLGSLPEIKNYIRMSESPCVRSIQFVEHIDEVGLIEYYRSSKTFVSPALFEGFGMPLIEAAASGGKILCSDIEVFREIMGDGAVYFDPTDPPTIRQKLNAVLTGKDNVNKADLTRFRWDRICELLEAQFENVARN